MNAIWTILARRTSERAVATAELCDYAIHAYGHLHRSETELRAGDRVLNHDREILPRIAHATGLGLAIYLGNRRIAAASVLDTGSVLEVGGFADAVLVETTLRKRESFRGTLSRSGRNHFVATRPLYAGEHPDEHGPIGMVECFQDEQAYFEMLSAGVRMGMEGESGSLRSGGEQMEAVMLFIDDVARKLQLLALNGNIIAAQAGESGRAFRVVCRELGALADQAKGAVKEVQKVMAIMGVEPAPDGPLLDEPPRV